MSKRPGAAIEKRLAKQRAIDGGAPRAIGVDEAAALLRIGTTKIKELIRDKEIRSFKIGNSTRIPIQSIDEYIAKQMNN